MNTDIPFEQIGVDSYGRPRYYVFGQEIEYGASAGYYGAKPTTETRNTKVTFPDGKDYIVDLDIAKDGHVTITYGTPNGGYYGAGYNKDTAQSMSSSDFNSNFGVTTEPAPTKARRPMVCPHTMVQLAPNDAPSFTSVRS